MCLEYSLLEYCMLLKQGIRELKNTEEGAKGTELFPDEEQPNSPESG